MANAASAVTDQRLFRRSRWSIEVIEHRRRLAFARVGPAFDLGR
jgi:hypothetical protein